MNEPEIPDGLEAARQIIKFNHPFEYRAHNGQWRNPKLGVDAIRYVANGFDIRIKPLPDKWADLKKAHADGKTIQWKYLGEAGHLWRDTMMPIWKEGTDYRIKPEPVKVPLGPEDVPPGSVLRGPSDKPEVWAAVMAMTPHGIMLADSRSVSFAVIEKGWKINRSLSNGKWNPTAWEPCYKEVTKE